MKTTAAKTVTADKTNTKLTLLTRKSIGAKKCPGDAHENGHIDHCMVCLGSRFGYGMVEAFEEPTIEDVLAGFAVPLSWTRDGRDTFYNAEKAGLIKMVNVNEKLGRGSRSNYNVWAKA